MSRGAALRWLASRRRVAVGQRGRRFPSNSSSPGLWQDRLGSPRGRCAGRSSARPGGVPQSEQEGRQGTEIRQVRPTSVSGERDAAGGGRHPREHLSDRAAPAEEAILTEDRAARQALQAILPHR